MKLKSWMEAHIVLHTKWKKKDKRKKSSDKSKNQAVRDTSTSLPSWRTSNFLQFFVTTNTSSSKQSKTLPEPRDKSCKPQRPGGHVAPEDIAASNPQPPQCGDGVLSIHALHVHLADQLDAGSLSSPRQRNKIRTNPWLTPKQQQRSLPSSECNSGSWDPWRSSYLSSSTVESSDLQRPSGDKGQPPEPFKKLPKMFPGKTDDSDSEECETLNEMGNFDEHYEYDWETAESDILGDEPDSARRRPSKRRSRMLQALPATLPQLKWRDLRSDEDYSERLDYVDEAYSEMSGSSTEGRGSGFSDSDEKDGRGRGGSPEADSAFPSESEISSAATTPLMEGTGVGSSSGSDSGIQPHSGWAGPESGRTLRGIRDSLEDKVRHLRFERLIVEDRIREAKEEEEQRRLEKERFRKELVSHRRLVLLRTLEELRLKLEDHGARLQEAYHSTLEMQMSCRRQLATVVEEIPAARTPTTHEKLL